MRKLLALILVMGLALPSGFGATSGVERAGGSSGGVTSVGDSDSGDSVVGGTYAKQVFDPMGLDGVIRYYVQNGTYQNGLDWNYDADNREVTVSGVNGTNRITLPLNADIQTLHAGGTKGIATYDLTAKTISYYRFEETSGTSVADSIGSNTGTSVGEISTTLRSPGAVGGGFLTQGGSGVDLGTAADLKYAGDFTVCVQHRTREGNETSAYRIFGNRTASAGNAGFEISIQADSSHTVPATARFTVDIGATTYNTSGSSELDDNVFHVICGRRSGSTFSLWVDGASEGTPSGSSSASLSAAGNMQIGGAPYAGYDGDGYTDNLAFFNDDLSDAEIQALTTWWAAGNDGVVIYPASGPHVFSETENETSSYATDGNDVVVGDVLHVKGNVYGANYFSGDGTQGATTTCADGTSLTVKDGLITACS